MFGILKRLFAGTTRSHPPLQPESQFVVHLSDSEVVCQRPDGQTERVAWDDLQAFIVETTDDGPWVPDVFWILVGTSESGCVVPQGATNHEALLERLQQLPGFDNKQLIEAMGSTSNQKFLCWKRQ